MRIKFILLFATLSIILVNNNVLSKTIEHSNNKHPKYVLTDQYYCIDGSAYTEFHYEVNNISTVYQWQADNGSGFVDLVDDINFSGVNTQNLGISFIDMSYDGLKIRCKYTIGGVDDYSNTAYLWVREPFLEETSTEICMGGTYTWRGNDYSNAGTYYDSLVSVSGCDSIYKLTITQYNITKNDTIVICEGDSAFLQNAWQTQFGDYTDTIVVANQCDTIVYTYLYVETSSIFDHISICEGESVFLDGQWQTESGMYIDNYVSANGCNIQKRTYLVVKAKSYSTVNKTICEGETYYFNGEALNTQGQYEYTTTSLINGCDSVVTLNLNVTELPNINLTSTPQTIEEGNSIQLNIYDLGTCNWTTTDTTISCTNCINPTASPTQTTTYSVSVYANGCIVKDSVTVTVIEKKIVIDIPEGFSPNKDGINDNFEIKNIEMFETNEIKIFNRWGHKVFSAKPYVNNWRGTNFFGISIGEDLPEGTYFYILELNDSDNQIIKGSVYLKR